MIENNQKELTIGSHPTTVPPLQDFPLHITSGRFAICATTGYPFSVPNDDNHVLSAYKIYANGFLPGGSEL